MYISAMCVIFCAFYIHSARSGPLTENLKLSQASAVCPPGVWTCSTGKRSEIARVETLRHAKNSYPSGIWTRDESEEPRHLNDGEEQEDCPPGMWVCRKKRMLKQILKTALMKSSQDSRVTKLNPSQVSNDACPPGVWTCSTGKRSEIIKEAQVTVETAELDESSVRSKQRRTTKTCPPGMLVCDEIRVWTCSTGKRSEIIKEAQVTEGYPMLNEPLWENTAKEDSSPLLAQKASATKSCAPGMWVCDEINEN
ncbi:hypothetical protein ACROYT_G001998 [Oculina patagonica]